VYEINNKTCIPRRYFVFGGSSLIWINTLSLDRCVLFGGRLRLEASCIRVSTVTELAIQTGKPWKAGCSMILWHRFLYSKEHALKQWHKAGMYQWISSWPSNSNGEAMVGWLHHCCVPLISVIKWACAEALTQGCYIFVIYFCVFSNMVRNMFLKCQRESCFQLQVSFYLSLEFQKMQVSKPSSFSLQPNSNSVFPSLGNTLHLSGSWYTISSFS